MDAIIAAESVIGGREGEAELQEDLSNYSEIF